MITHRTWATGLRGLSCSFSAQKYLCRLYTANWNCRFNNWPLWFFICFVIGLSLLFFRGVGRWRAIIPGNCKLSLLYITMEKWMPLQTLCRQLYQFCVHISYILQTKYQPIYWVTTTKRQEFRSQQIVEQPKPCTIKLAIAVTVIIVFTFQVELIHRTGRRHVHIHIDIHITVRGKGEARGPETASGRSGGADRPPGSGGEANPNRHLEFILSLVRL